MEKRFIHAVPYRPAFIRERRTAEYFCNKLKLRGKKREFILKFFTVLMYRIEKTKLEGIKPRVFLPFADDTFIVATYHAMRMLGKPVDLKQLAGGSQHPLKLNKIYEEQINFKSVEEVEKEYKKIMDEYDEEKRGLHKRDKAIA